MPLPPKHRHRYTKPVWLDPMGFVKQCKGKGDCPKRQKSVKMEEVRRGKT